MKNHKKITKKSPWDHFLCKELPKTSKTAPKAFQETLRATQEPPKTFNRLQKAPKINLSWYMNGKRVRDSRASEHVAECKRVARASERGQSVARASPAGGGRTLARAGGGRRRVLRASWGLLGRIWHLLGVFWEASEALLGSFWRPLEGLRRPLEA